MFSITNTNESVFNSFLSLDTSLSSVSQTFFFGTYIDLEKNQQMSIVLRLKFDSRNIDSQSRILIFNVTYKI